MSGEQITLSNNCVFFSEYNNCSLWNIFKMRLTNIAAFLLVAATFYCAVAADKKVEVIKSLENGMGQSKNLLISFTGI